ncbi:hypothetical protein RUM43_015061 [Polyplax serrata]|uniref:Uncharacterized protein n=1 Tax=Polyplax serrata TaxID=468196 RepID=A0AAN8RRV3_POLSC
MCHTLLLKQVQDVYERESNARPEYYVRLARTIIMAAPWAELLYSIGAYHSGASGIFVHVVQPARPAEPEPWWTVDPTLVMKWNREMGRLQHLYMMPGKYVWAEALRLSLFLSVSVSGSSSGRNCRRTCSAAATGVRVGNPNASAGKTSPELACKCLVASAPRVPVVITGAECSPVIPLGSPQGLNVHVPHIAKELRNLV